MAAEAPLLFSQALQMGEEKRPQPMSLGEAVEKVGVFSALQEGPRPAAVAAGLSEHCLRFGDSRPWAEGPESPVRDGCLAAGSD